MGSRPTVTVLVPTFNRAQFLAECLDSLLKQTLPPSQVLVVDDGSVDHTQQVLSEYKDRVEILITPQIGKPGAINVGLKKVRGEYLWIFDDDDVALPDALERFVAPLLVSTSCGFSYSTFFFTPSQSGSHRLGEATSELVIPDVERHGFLPALLENNFLGGAALFARTSCYDVVGDFDEKLLRSQDYEMAVRIARKFKGVRAARGATFHYRQHGELRGNSRDRFVSGKRLIKWLEYDQIFFRRIYQELALGDYLPEHKSWAQAQRQALLQRLAVMANKLLIDEAQADVALLEKDGDETPFTEDEKRIIRCFCQPTYYKTGNILDNAGFVRFLAKKSATSKAIAALYDQIFSTVMRQWNMGTGLRELQALAIRTYRLVAYRAKVRTATG